MSTAANSTIYARQDLMPELKFHWWHGLVILLGLVSLLLVIASVFELLDPYNSLFKDQDETKDPGAITTGHHNGRAKYDTTNGGRTIAGTAANNHRQFSQDTAGIGSAARNNYGGTNAGVSTASGTAPIRLPTAESQEYTRPTGIGSGSSLLNKGSNELGATSGSAAPLNQQQFGGPRIASEKAF